MNSPKIVLLVSIVSLVVSFGSFGPLAHAQDGDVAYDNLIVTQLVAEGLVTPINHEAVINGVDTTIDWVYADVIQVIVCLTMRNLDYDTTGPDAIPAKEIVRMVSPKGTELQPSTASATVSNTSDSRFDLTVVTHFYPQDRMLPPLQPGEARGNYFVELGADLPTTLDLQVKLDIVTNPTSDTITRPLPGDPAELTLPVTVTFHHGITLTPQTTITVNDQDVTLERLTIAPSQTQAEVCYALADTENWQPVTRLHLDDQYVLPIAHATRATHAPAEENYVRCFEMPFDIFHRDVPSTVTFAVEFLFLSPSNPLEYWENVRDGLTQDGIELELFPSPGVYYAVASAPADLDAEDVYQRIRTQRISATPALDGPWVFTLEIPSLD